MIEKRSAMRWKWVKRMVGVFLFAGICFAQFISDKPSSAQCVYCEQLPDCNGTDVPCPGCDEVGTATCSDVTFRDYKGDEVYIERCINDANATKKCQFQDNVLCYSSQSCAEGGWISLTMCSSGIQCVSVPLPLMFCQLCVKSGTPNNTPKPDYCCVNP